MGFLKHFWHDSHRASAADNRNMGETRLVHGEYAEALTNLTEAIRLEPQNATAYLDRGLAYEKAGQYRRAIRDSDAGIRLDPRNAAAYINRGNAYFALDEFDEAIDDYSAAIRVAPNMAEAYYFRGLAHEENGAQRRGNADLDRAARLDPTLRGN